MADDLVALAFDDPVRRRVWHAGSSSPRSRPTERAIGHQALGIALRDQGRLEEALPRLRRR